MEMNTDIIGYIASVCTTVAFLPQVIQTYKTRSVEGISLTTFSVFAFGIILWLIFGILTENGPITIANLLTLLLILTQIFFLVKLKKK